LRALDRLPHGVFLLDTVGRVLSMNAMAQRIVREKDGLTVASDELRAARPDETRRLARMIVESGRSALGSGVAAGGVLRLQRKSSRPAYEVLVCPLSVDALMLVPNRAVVAIFVSDPEAGSPPAPDVFQTLYGLTPAEARVAHLLATGCGLVAVADELHVTRETVRTHLKNIFAKTGTSRQSQLVRLALSGPAALRQAVDR
jgi:DNA-binding CsgD family transcriptional regulator